MKKWKVIVEISNYDYGKNDVDKRSVTTKTVTVEAGNKKLACVRALAEIAKIEGDVWKSVKSVEEVK